MSQLWLFGIRPRTLTLAAVPVVVGAALAWSRGAGVDQLTLLVTLSCAVLIQIGTNLFNDSSDGLRGADGPERIGPPRLTGAGLASAAQVRNAGIVSFALALAAGLYLVLVGGLPILLIGLASLTAGYAYSAGPRPLSHGPWGELYVIVFFGIVAVAGSYYLQMRAPPDLAVLIAGAAIGCPAAAVLVVNNTRDLDADRSAGRRTLAGRLGPATSSWLYAALMLAPFPLLVVALGWAQAGLAVIALPLAVGLFVRFRKLPPGPEMNEQLARTALAQTLLGALLIVGLLT